MNERFLLACTYCESPAVFGPSGWGDYVLVGAAILIVGWTLRKAVTLLLNPGEKDPKHIKTRALDPTEFERKSR